MTHPAHQPSLPHIETADLEPSALPGVAPAAATGLLPSLAVAITPITPPAAQEAALHQRLLARVARSAAANAGFETRRLGDGLWRDLAPGVRACTQHADAAHQTTLIELAPGAVLALGPETNLHAAAGTMAGAVHECLVLRGVLQMEAPALGSPALQAQDYQLIGLDAAALTDSRLRSDAGALLCWRSTLPGTGEFAQTQASHRVAHSANAWEPLRQGVKIKPLHSVAGRISMLVQFEPGARVPAHPHGLGEECLMVQGDLFLGDVLLREGEFQFAPAGSDHGELFSDVGCLLFFSGAIDPCAVDPAVRVGY